MFSQQETEKLIRRAAAGKITTMGEFQHLVSATEGIIDFDEMLPRILQLDGKPMNVVDRRPMFRPLFKRVRKSRREVYICGRQIGKSASAGGSMVTHLNLRRGFRSLYVAPLAMYVSRMHHTYMGPMQATCQLPWIIQNNQCVNNVSEKTFASGGHYHGVSCFNSPRGALGLTVDAATFDEVQDLNIEYIPQIREVLGTSNYRWETYLGTARTLDNTLQVLFEQSSQNEWHMRCPRCGYVNIPIGEDALKMIQPQGIGCARCSTLERFRPLDVNNGWWKPMFKEREKTFRGFHVPQTIVKDRITPHDRYVDTIYNKLHGVERYSLARFQQEVMGISSEQGARPITIQQIREASTLPASHRIEEYSHITGGADWGGSEITSFTVGTMVGLHYSGKFHCLGAIRPTGIQDNFRHLPIAAYMKRMGGDRLKAIGADGGFVGSVQNRNLAAAAGVPCASILYGSKKNFFQASGGHFNIFTVDRSTLLYIVFSMIVEGKLLLPSDPGFQIFWDDLMAVSAADLDTPSGTVRRYQRMASKADDFLHALGYGLFTCALMSGRDLPSMIGLAANSSVNRTMMEDIGDERGVLYDPSGNLV